MTSFALASCIHGNLIQAEDNNFLFVVTPCGESPPFCGVMGAAWRAAFLEVFGLGKSWESCFRSAVNSVLLLSCWRHHCLLMERLKSITEAWSLFSLDSVGIFKENETGPISIIATVSFPVENLKPTNNMDYILQWRTTVRGLSINSRIYIVKSSARTLCSLYLCV